MPEQHVKCRQEDEHFSSLNLCSTKHRKKRSLIATVSSNHHILSTLTNLIGWWDSRSYRSLSQFNCQCLSTSVMWKGHYVLASGIFWWKSCNFSPIRPTSFPKVDLKCDLKSSFWRYLTCSLNMNSTLNSHTWYLFLTVLRWTAQSQNDEMLLFLAAIPRVFFFGRLVNRKLDSRTSCICILRSQLYGNRKPTS